MSNNKTRKRARGGRQRPPPPPAPLPRPEALMAPTTTAGGMVIREGVCERGSCGSEAACKRLSDNKFTCICPHDSSTPTDDLRCPNRNTVDMSPSPIHNIRPPVSNVSMSSPASPSSVSHPHPHAHNTSSSVLATLQDPMSEQHLHVMLAVLAVPCLVLSLLSLFCCWRNRKSHRCCGFNKKHCKPGGKDNTAPVSLNRGLLASDQYAPNPQYSPFSAGGELAAPLAVPLLARDQVTFLHDIGEGCFGKVYKGELRSPEGVETVAIKVLKESATTEAEEDFMREVEIMSAFKHPNILSLLGVSLRETNARPWMVFEFMPHGDLTEVLRSNSRVFWAPSATSPRLNKESLLDISRQIADGMAYLAAQRFVHRDLACRNCLVGDNLAVKIADFGMSRDVYTCDYYKIGGSRLLPVRWMSPESVMYGRFTLESDVWSYGVVLWEIFSLGKQPYYGHSNEEVVRLIMQGIMLIPPEDCPLFVCELMRACWKTEPRDRTTFTQIQQTLQKAATATPTTLPRPPAFPVTPLLATEVMDDDNYLKPLPSEPKEYLQTLPD